jgi:hypothetical protein
VATWVLFVSPGIRSTDAAAAKVRYEGEDEKDDYLDEARVRSVAGELMREHPLQVASEDDEDSGSPRGLDLDGAGAAASPEVRVDGWGITVSIHEAEEVAPGLAIARSASRLLAGAVYDAERELILELDGTDAQALRAAAEVFARSGTAPAPPQSMKRARTAAILFMLVPTVGFVIARRFLGSGLAFAAVFVAMASMAVFTSWWVRRPAPAAPRPGESPPMTAPPREDASFGNRPIKPG